MPSPRLTLARVHHRVPSKRSVGVFICLLCFHFRLFNMRILPLVGGDSHGRTHDTLGYRQRMQTTSAMVHAVQRRIMYTSISRCNSNVGEILISFQSPLPCPSLLLMGRGLADFDLARFVSVIEIKDKYNLPANTRLLSHFSGAPDSCYSNGLTWEGVSDCITPTKNLRAQGLPYLLLP